MKFSSAVGNIVTVHVDQKMTGKCYVASLKVESTSRYTRPHRVDDPRERRGPIRILDSVLARGAIKSQALADFASELSPHPNDEEGPQWILHVDGFSNNRSCGAGVVLEGSGDVLFEQALKFEFKTSNN